MSSSREYALAYNKQYKLSRIGNWSRYKSQAKKRKIDWLLNYDEFQYFWCKPCHYCGDNSFKVGLDRVDNTKPYIFNNLVSCCKVCNRMKSNSDVTFF